MIPIQKQRVKLFLSLSLCILFLLSALTVSVAASSSYVGNKSTKVYHTTQCTFAEKISAKNRVYFSSRTGAESSGYRRCHYCGDDIVEPGQGSSSSGNHSSPTTPPSTQPPATEPQPSQTIPKDTASWWEELRADHVIFICSFVALPIAVGLYFLFIHLENKKSQQMPKFITVLFFIFAAVAIPSAVLVFSIVFICGGLIACTITGIKWLYKHIKRHASSK